MALFLRAKAFTQYRSAGGVSPLVCYRIFLYPVPHADVERLPPADTRYTTLSKLFSECGVDRTRRELKKSRANLAQILCHLG